MQVGRVDGASGAAKAKGTVRTGRPARGKSQSIIFVEKQKKWQQVFGFVCLVSLAFV